MDRRRYLSAPFFVWFLGFVVGPIGFIAATSVARRTSLGQVEPDFNFESYAQLFDPLYLEVLWRTLGFASATTAFSLLFAYPVAFYVSRLPPARRPLVLALVLIPLWTNFLVRLLATMDVLRMRPFGWDGIYTAPGVVFAMAYCYLPLAILPIYASLSKIESSLLEAARDLGASKLQVFLRVLWPISKPGVLTAFAIVFIPSFGEYLTPTLVGGGRFLLLGNFLQAQFVSARNWPLGSAAIVLLVMLTLALLFAAQSPSGIATGGESRKGART